MSAASPGAPRPTRERWGLFLAGAIATAGLLALCGRMVSPFHWLLPVALVPWLFALEEARSAREAAAAGALLSIAFAAGLFPWFPGAVARYSGASGVTVWAVFLLLAPLLAPQLIVYAHGRHLVRSRGGRLAALRAAIAAGCLYVGVELLVPKLFFDTLGLGLYPSRPLRQAADLLGVHGLTLLVLLLNEAIFASLRSAWQWRARRLGTLPVEALQEVEPPPSGPIAKALRHPLAPLAFAGVSWLGLYGYGAYRIAEIEAHTAGVQPTVGVVQANITNYDKLRAEKGAYETVRAILDGHRSLSAELLRHGVPDVLVWPETVYPTTFGAPKNETGAEFDDEIRAFVRETRVPLVFGAYESDGGAEHNSAFLLSPSESGEVTAISYRKRMLFPLTEWVPEALDSAALRRALPWTGSLQRGPGARVLPLGLQGGGTLSIVPLICYDVLFSDFVAEGAGLGADAIVTLSNDSWFPDERAPRLHLVSAAFRSVETHLPQVRATNSGISAVIDATGEIVEQTPWDKPALLGGALPLAGRRITPRMVLGRYFGPVTIATGLVLVAMALAQARRRKATKPGTTTK